MNGLGQQTPLGPHTYCTVILSSQTEKPTLEWKSLEKAYVCVWWRKVSVIKNNPIIVCVEYLLVCMLLYGPGLIEARTVLNMVIRLECVCS